MSPQETEDDEEEEDDPPSNNHTLFSRTLSRQQGRVIRYYFSFNEFHANFRFSEKLSRLNVPAPGALSSARGDDCATSSRAGEFDRICHR